MGHRDNVADEGVGRNDLHVRDARPKEAETRLPIYVVRSQSWRDLIEQGGHAAQVFLLLLGHARSAPGGKMLAWVPVRRLADLTAAWRKTVYASLKLLKEKGWIVAQRERGPRRGDEYTLAFPGDAGEAHAQVLARLTKKDGPAVESPLFQDGDVYFWNGAWHIREARIPVSALGSWLWAELRRASPQAMQVYLLLVAYSHESRLGMARLAREARVYKGRVSEAIRLLREMQFIHIATEEVGKRRGRDSYTILPIDSSPARSPEMVPDAAPPPRPAPAEQCEHCGAALHQPAKPEPEIEGVTPPPPDLVALLEREVPQVSAHYPATEVWAYLRAYGFWPRRESSKPEPLPSVARRMVTEFHAEVRGAQGYEPTRQELQLAEVLADRYGHGERGYCWFVLQRIVLRMQRTKFIAGNFGAVRKYLAEVEHDYPEIVVRPDVARPDPS